MVFSSFVFIAIFLPFTLLINLFLKQKSSNYFLLFASLVFYYYGEQKLISILLISISWNYAFAVFLSKYSEQLRIRKLLLFFGLIGNVSLLFYYKYFVFTLHILGLKSLFSENYLNGILLPIGISFFTFQGVSYLIDVYRKEVNATKNILDVALYISFFPQLVAGPIVKYHDIHLEIKKRSIKLNDFTEGTNRFILGFFKKVVISNNLAVVADSVFDADLTEISNVSAWFGLVCYALQIYYDFSAYSDMAIGLGKMMGFHFKENFNYPYKSKSIKEFWQRWHISLSTWFKEYIYIPLGGNQKGVKRTYFNLFLVFILTGIWHGASLNFVIWGLFHGLFIVLERMEIIKIKNTFLSHVYLVFVVLISWVFFRAEGFSNAITYLKKLFFVNNGDSNYSLIYVTYYFVGILVLALLFSFPLKNKISHYLSTKNKFSPEYLLITKQIVYLIIFLFSILELSSLSYNPFIYFRF